jgi:hypothetical protein
MKMYLRLIEGLGKQEGRVAVMWGPLLFCLNPELNDIPSDIDLRDIILYPSTLRLLSETRARTEFGRISCSARAFIEDHGDTDLILTEFTDPNGEFTYFLSSSYEIAEKDELHFLT